MKEKFSLIKQQIFPYLPVHIQNVFSKLTEDSLSQMEEIRLRAGKPLLCWMGDEEYTFSAQGEWMQDFSRGYRVTEEEIQRTAAAVSEHSCYAFEEEMKRGFITLPGGHRVGISGQVLCYGGKVQSLRNISGLAFRVARECKGCADDILHYFYKDNHEIASVLLVSPPRCGKTTLLRDVCRQLSDGNSYAPGQPVTIIDERSEIAGSFRGIPQLDVGIRTDVLDGCLKAQGMMMALRSLAPGALIMDEISRPEDIQELKACVFSGVSIITTVHAADYQEVRRREGIRQLLEDGVFQKAVILSRRRGPGTVENVVECG